MKTEIFSKLYAQYNLDDFVTMDSVTSPEKKDELQQEGFLVGMTKEDWNSRYPSIPAEKIICIRSTFFPMELMYYDKSKGILFRAVSPWMEESGFTTPQTEETLLKRIREMEAFFNAKEYSKMLISMYSEGSGNISMRLIENIYDAVGASPELYKAFIDNYSMCDCGATLIGKRKQMFYKTMKPEDIFCTYGMRSKLLRTFYDAGADLRDVVTIDLALRKLRRNWCPTSGCGSQNSIETEWLADWYEAVAEKARALYEKSRRECW